MSDTEKPPVSEARAAQLARAREAAAAARKEHGPTPKQKEAVERMQAGKRAKDEARRAVKAGGVKPDPITSEDDGPPIEPAPYPERTAAPAPAEPAAEPVKGDPVPELDLSPVPPAAPAPAQSSDTPTPKRKSWLRHAAGL